MASEVGEDLEELEDELSPLGGSDSVLFGDDNVSDSYESTDE